jgi:aerobic-type carbon monoxide dehydrogenase small subunit (CoxS/CutS family)
VSKPIRLYVNGRAVAVAADPLTPLRTVLGELLALRSVRIPCGVGACGGCTVLVDGRPVKSCLYPAGLAEGQTILTAEGLPPDDPVAAAFVAANAFQCGFCSPGFVMAVHGLLAEALAPDDITIRAALTGNLCRCGSYPLILEAVRELAGEAAVSQ